MPHPNWGGGQKEQLRPVGQKLAFVDALRGWAILGVIAVHVGQNIHGLNSILGSLTNEGQRGVQLFYLKMIQI